MNSAISHSPERPRVVRLIARLNVGGPAQHVAWLNAGLRDEFDCTLIAGNISPGEDEMTDFARNMGVEPIIVSGLSREISLRDLPAAWHVYRLLLKLKPDIVHTHTAKAGTIGRIAATLYRWFTPATLIGRPRACRVVHTYHGHVFHSYFGRTKTRLILLIEKVLAQVTDRIVVISRRQLEEITSLLGADHESQFCIIPLGLDLERFSGWQNRRPFIREAIGAEPDDILVGIVGRLVDVKNHELFLNAVAAFVSDYASRLDHRVRFVIIGNGPLQEQLMQQSRDLHLAGHVTFMGLRTDPENFYPGLDIVMLTSKNEGTPLSLIEAMANGRPVLSTAVGGVVDLLGDLRDVNSSPLTRSTVSPAAPHSLPMPSLKRKIEAVCAVHAHGLAAAADPASLAAGVFQLAADSQLRATLGTQGEMFARQAHSIDRLLKDVTGLYRSLLSMEPESTTRE
ncbi:MAG: glycosyltransferase [Planctomycetaceae bacterium]